MSRVIVRRTPNGFSYLNAGCGKTYSADWNNIDRNHGPHISCHDLRKPLPYPDNTFDAVYSSHVLEHLDPEKGDQLLMELFRTCKPGGVCRIVVPDYERVCREYLHCLETAIEQPDASTIQRYNWIVLELIDQFVREKTGGRMLEALMSGNFDKEYVRQRCGEEFSSFLDSSSPGKHDDLQSNIESFNMRIRRLFSAPWQEIPKGIIFHIMCRFRGRLSNPTETGEVHRWIYDRLGLKILMEKAGYTEVCIKTHDESMIPDWPKYYLDSIENGKTPRKPDSLYMEGMKPVPGNTMTRPIL